MKKKITAPHKSVSNPLGHTVPVIPTSGHWSFKAPKGRRRKNSIIIPAVTITPGDGGFVVRRATPDKTPMGKGSTYEEAKRVAFNLGFRHLKSGLTTKELSLG